MAFAKSTITPVTCRLAVFAMCTSAIFSTSTSTSSFGTPSRSSTSATATRNRALSVPEDAAGNTTGSDARAGARAEMGLATFVYIARTVDHLLTILIGFRWS